MTDDEYALARRGLAQIHAAVSSLPPEELEALRAVAASGADDVVGFGSFATFSVLASSGEAPVDDMFAVMMAYQKLQNAESREDRQLGSTSFITGPRRRFP